MCVCVCVACDVGWGVCVCVYSKCGKKHMAVGVVPSEECWACHLKQFRVMVEWKIAIGR